MDKDFLDEDGKLVNPFSLIPDEFIQFIKFIKEKYMRGDLHVSDPE